MVRFRFRVLFGSGLGLPKLFKRLNTKLTVTLLVKGIKMDGLVGLAFVKPDIVTD